MFDGKLPYLQTIKSYHCVQDARCWWKWQCFSSRTEISPNTYLLLLSRCKYKSEERSHRLNHPLVWQEQRWTNRLQGIFEQHLPNLINHEENINQAYRRKPFLFKTFLPVSSTFFLPSRCFSFKVDLFSFSMNRFFWFFWGDYRFPMYFSLLYTFWGNIFIGVFFFFLIVEENESFLTGSFACKDAQVLCIREQDLLLWVKEWKFFTLLVGAVKSL